MERTVDNNEKIIHRTLILGNVADKFIWVPPLLTSTMSPTAISATRDFYDLYPYLKQLAKRKNKMLSEEENMFIKSSFNRIMPKYFATTIGPLLSAAGGQGAFYLSAAGHKKLGLASMIAGMIPTTAGAIMMAKQKNIPWTLINTLYTGMVPFAYYAGTQIHNLKNKE